jgi:acetyl-CoA acyltransferase
MTRAAFVVAGVRSPIGKAPKGSLRYVRPDDLLAHVIRSLLKQVPEVDLQLIDDVIIGCATPEAEQGLNVARIAALRAGLPASVPAFTLNRFCASGLEAIAIGAQRIMLGVANFVIAGGVESMSRIPMGGWHPSPNPTLMKTYPDVYLSMGLTAENLAERYGISREEQDAFALESHRKAVQAIDAGRFREEVAPVPVQLVEVRDGRPQDRDFVLEVDEGPRRDTSMEALAKLPPVFKQNGTVTAGNSSQMSDGAAAVLLASEPVIKQFRLNPWLRFIDYTYAGVAPELMGLGPVEALRRLVQWTGVALGMVDVVELNEAFAAQVLAVLRELPELDPGRVNPNGGAIALGHPLGCTGARQTVTLMHELRRRRGKYGIVTMCVGGGMGAAALFENVAMG